MMGEARPGGCYGWSRFLPFDKERQPLLNPVMLLRYACLTRLAIRAGF
jgi:hypothetical protein